MQTEPRITSWTLCKYPKSTTCRQKPKTTKTHSRYSDTRPTEQPRLTVDIRPTEQPRLTVDTRPTEQPRLTQVHNMQPEPLTTKTLRRYSKSTTFRQSPQQPGFTVDIPSPLQADRITKKQDLVQILRPEPRKPRFTANIPGLLHADMTKKNQDSLQISQVHNMQP